MKNTADTKQLTIFDVFPELEAGDFAVETIEPEAIPTRDDFPDETDESIQTLIGNQAADEEREEVAGSAQEEYDEQIEAAERQLSGRLAYYARKGEKQYSSVDDLSAAECRRRFKLRVAVIGFNMLELQRLAVRGGAGQKTINALTKAIEAAAEAAALEYGANEWRGH